MFRSFRKKPAKKDDEDESAIRTSPSLPELSTAGIPWPENLVDLAALPDKHAPAAAAAAVPPGASGRLAV